MIIGIPKEIKNNENRVALTASGAHELVQNGHDVVIETKAGLGSGITDEMYQTEGAKVVKTAKQVFDAADMIVKVKEPLEQEYDLFKQGQVLFTYLHLAANKPLTKAMLKKQITGIAYETIQMQDGTLPLLIPMSEVAGRMSVQVAAMLQQKYYGGSGMLLGGVPGVAPAEVVIIGGGVVGSNAAYIATGMGANVTILDTNQRKLVALDEQFRGRVNTVMSNRLNVANFVQKADVLIGAVLIPGAVAPKIVTEAMVKTMKNGSVIVDVAIDQGGSIETIDRVTTHDNPSFKKHGVVHYSVANMPGAVAHTSTYALTGVTLPWLLKMANEGVENALIASEPLRLGLNTYKGYITCPPVAEAMEMQSRRFAKIS